MSEKKSKLVEKVIIPLLCLLPVVSNGQNLKEDINWTKIKEPYGKYTLSIRSINPLPELSQYKSAPTSYLPHGNLNLGYNNTYTIPQDSIKGPIANYLKKIDVCPDCTKAKKAISVKKKTTPKKTSVKPISKPIIPVQKPVTPIIYPDTVKKEIEKEKATTEYNVNETNITNNYNIVNKNYYGDTTKIKQEQQKLSTLELRLLLEGYKTLNTTENPLELDNPFGGASGTLQLGNDWIKFGPYATVGFGSEKDSTPVYKKILLNQAIQLFTETEGIEKSKLTYPVGFGGTLSLSTKDDRVGFHLSYGFVNEVNSGFESGFDRKLQGDNTIEEKPYGPIKTEKKKWIPTEKIAIAFKPFKKLGAYIAAEAQKIDENINFNAKLGWIFGGKK